MTRIEGNDALQCFLGVLQPSTPQMLLCGLEQRLHIAGTLASGLLRAWRCRSSINHAGFCAPFLQTNIKATAQPSREQRRRLSTGGGTIEMRCQRDNASDIGICGPRKQKWEIVEMAKKRVGFIGVGLMGHGMAK